ncbi:MAG: AbrB/MazE/SpoVT family DNA-binding domain-containing protein [Oscillospiraceae bacterium]|nr:AbrB/MazE/SpoVT family DNA-binding domain-containing protein [Oscillospiraceae bacterium]
MKATGMIRKIDDLGRVVIPRELRKTMGLDGAALELYTDGDQKYAPGCVCCGEAAEEVCGIRICRTCAEALLTALQEVQGE